MTTQTKAPPAPVSVRFTEEQIASLRDEARREGRDVSWVIRRKCFPPQAEEGNGTTQA